MLHPSFRVIRVPFRLSTCRPIGFDPSHHHRRQAIVNLSTRSQDTGRRNRTSEIFPRFLPHGRSHRLRTISGNDKFFVQSKRMLWVETHGGGMSNRDGGDGSHRRSVMTGFMRR